MGSEMCIRDRDNTMGAPLALYNARLLAALGRAYARAGREGERAKRDC